MLDNEGYIINIVNNYEFIDFNFGPTLLSWMSEYAPETLRWIIEGDRLSCERHNGHGNAIAQVYNHLIMPLASSRDKETQVKWGIADFRYRFGRRPEGMWLAETAKDRIV
jgi:alpha-amylase/alpha-mannosidase (GH57 family)